MCIPLPYPGEAALIPMISMVHRDIKGLECTPINLVGGDGLEPPTLSV